MGKIGMTEIEKLEQENEDLRLRLNRANSEISRLRMEANNRSSNKPPQQKKGDPENPWSEAGWNITKQFELLKNDPITAAHLKKAAAR